MKRILSALAIFGTLTAVCHASAPTLLNEDFDDGIAQSWVMLNGSPTFTNGALRIVSTGFGNDVRAIYLDSTWSNYVFQADILIQNSGTSPWPASFLFHVVEASSGLDNGRYYQFNVGPTLLSFVKVNYSGGNAQGLISTNRTLTTGVWHQVRIEIEDITAKAFIDGQQVLTYSGFTDFRSGGVGLKGINSAQILYDNVLVTGSFQPTLGIRFSQVELSWDTVTNKTYQVQYRSSLTADQWTDLGPSMSGTGGMLTVKDDIVEGAPRRFYQIVQTP